MNLVHSVLKQLPGQLKCYFSVLWQKVSIAYNFEIFDSFKINFRGLFEKI